MLLGYLQGISYMQSSSYMQSISSLVTLKAGYSTSPTAPPTLVCCCTGDEPSRSVVPRPHSHPSKAGRDGQAAATAVGAEAAAATAW